METTTIDDKFEEVKVEIDDVAQTLVDTLVVGKREFVAMLRQKISYLDVRCQILRLKQDRFKSIFDGVQIFIIVLSSVLTLWEAVRSQMRVQGHVSVDAYNAIACLPVVMSSIISLAAAILKFKNYRTKIDSMTSTVEKVSFVMLSARKLIENTIHATSLQALDEARQKYIDDIHPAYTSVDQRIAEDLKLHELVRYKSMFLESKLQMEKEENDYVEEKCELANDTECKTKLKAGLKSSVEVLPVKPRLTTFGDDDDDEKK